MIVKLASLGDILMATPLLPALREAYPDAYITWVVEHTFREVIDANPYVDEIVAWDGYFWQERIAARWKNMLNREKLLGLRWLRSALKLGGQLRRRKLDTYITFHADQWPLLARGGRVPVRIGVFDMFPQFDEARHEYAGLYTTAYYAEDLPLHHTDRYLLPLRALGLPTPTEKKMMLGYTAEDATSVDRFLRDHSVTDRFIVIAPKTTWETRNWPEDRYVELADRLGQETECRIIMIGSPGERAIVERIAAKMRVNPIRAAGVFGFRQMAALLERAALVVSGDTGPMHVAAAVGTPYLALFGPTPVAGRVPLTGRSVVLSHPVPCGPCDLNVCANTPNDFLLCMRLITVREVLAAAERLLSETMVPA